MDETHPGTSRLNQVSKFVVVSMRQFNLCAAPIASIALTLVVAAMAPINPAQGIPVVQVRLGIDHCGDSRYIVVFVTSSGRLQIGAEPVTDAEFDKKLAESLRTRAEKVVFVDAAGNLAFGKVAGVLGRVRRHTSVVALIPAHADSRYYCLHLPAAPTWTPGYIPLRKPVLSPVNLLDAVIPIRISASRATF